MRSIRTIVLCASALTAVPAMAAEDAAEDRGDIIVTGARAQTDASTKTDTPVLETPQPITIVLDETYLAQGALSIADTVRYVAGVQANPYGPDSRVDGVTVRGISALQYRDGMRDVFSYYASIRADPYNFSQVELVRGPASTLFGQGALGGLFNMVSKRPEFRAGGEVSLRYGSFDRKEALADVTGPITESVAARLAVRVRDSGTQTDHVPDDRVMIAPSLTWQPGERTELTFLGLYQEDDGGSTSQFLPLVGTLLPNPNGKLPNDLFIGKPGWDRYDGRLLQGTALLRQGLGSNATLNLKARYIDSDLDYFTHYPDSYRNPANPYIDPQQRIIGLYADGSRARMEIFSSDNNLQVDFGTGTNVEQTVLVGVDYSWNHVRKIGAFGYEFIDIYDIDYDALSDYGGGLPPGAAASEDVEQEQIGIYVQDQIRVADRVSFVLGARRDWFTSKSFGVQAIDTAATTFRAGVIGDLTPGISPFFSYTESFNPIAGTTSDGSPFKPQQGRQYEAGVKFHPGETTLVTVTAYHIKESNRPIADPNSPDPNARIQAGSFTSKGIELEGSTVLPGDFQLLANFSYNSAQVAGTGVQVDNIPEYNASAWARKPFALSDEVSLLVGAGVRYAGKNTSGPIETPDYALVDAMAELSWREWALTINATNLLDKRFYSACLARGDCFMGEERNVFATVSYRF